MNKPSLFKYFLNVPLVAFIVTVFSLTFSVNVSAATSVKPLPYFVNDTLNFPFSSYCNAYDQNWGSSYPIDWDNEQILMWSIEDGNLVKTYLAYPAVEGASYFVDLDNVPYDTFDCSIDTLSITFVGAESNTEDWWIIEFRENLSNNTVTAYGWQHQDTWQFFGSPMRFPKYLNGGWYSVHYISDDLPVLICNYQEGYPIPPNDPDDIPDSPDNPPQIEDYLPTPSTPPVITNDINGLVTWLQWKLSFFIDTVKGLFQYLTDVIRYVIQKVINNIVNAIKTFYDNLQNFFKPFFDKIIDFINSIKDGTLLTTLFVPSASDVSNLLIANDDFGVLPLYVKLKTKISSIFTSIFSLEAAKRLYVPPSTFAGVSIGDFYIDFSWFDTYKSTTDAVISGFLVIGWVYWLFTNFAHILRGTATVTSKEIDNK